MQQLIITKPSEALQAAKQHLTAQTGHGDSSRYICYALSKLLYYSNITREEVSEVKLYLHEQLYPYNTLEAWLSRFHGIAEKEMFSVEGNEKMHITRLAWIDHMIVLYKEQGR